MDIYDPNQWTVEFARQRGIFCINFLKETNAKVIEKLREGNCKAAAAGIDRMLNGAVTLQNAGEYDMRPFLATYSFNQGLIAVCGITDASEEQRRQAAIAAFSDARDFSNASLREIAVSVIGMLQSGQNLQSIKTEICPNFPSELIGLMSDTDKIGGAPKPTPAVSANNTAVKPAPAYTGGASGGKGSGSGIIKTLLFILIPIAAIGLVVLGYWLYGFINGDIESGGGSRSRKEKVSNSRIEDSGETYSEENYSRDSNSGANTSSNNYSKNTSTNDNTSSKPTSGTRTTTTYHVSTTSGLRLRYGPSLENGIILEMPYLSTIEVYEINGEWAYACYKGTDGYCSAEYISPGPGN
ncbi:MAG: SH3 domain-containing protein [Clostridia bacterium]|nr:SH3 domain-containing protein [Clostridia bacterium]